MKQRLDVMLDLETLDIEPTGQILTIGAVKFNPLTLAEPHSEFYYRFNIDEQEEKGRTTSESTLEWWGNQSAEIINEAFGPENRTDVTTILKALKKYMVGVDKVWAQGTTFDISMLENISLQYGQPKAWPFWTIEDGRTLLARMPTDPRKKFTFAAHNALEDSRIQAKAIQLTYKHFGFTK